MSDNAAPSIPTATPVASPASAGTSAPSAPIVVDLTARPAPSSEVTPSDAREPAAATNAPEAPATPQADPEDAKRTAWFKEQSKRDKAAREREQAIKAAEDDIALARELKDLSKADKLAVLEKLGITYEGLTSDILSRHDKDPQVSAVEQQIAELKQQLEAERQSAQQAQVSHVINQLKRDIRSHVDSEQHAETYELVRAEQAYDDVYQVIEDYYVATNKLLTVDQAAAEVEEYLLGEATRYAKAKKVRALVAPPSEAPAGDSPIAKTNEQPGAVARPRLGESSPEATSTPVTLTNGVASSANPFPQSLQQTIEDSKRRAADLIRNGQRR